MDTEVGKLLYAAQLFAASFTQGGERSDIDAAIVFDRKALERSSPDHPMRSVSLTRLSIDLYARHSQFGTMRDIEEAIILGREALRLQPAPHPDRSVLLSNLAVFLSIRYGQCGGIQDLNEAIDLGREALRLWPPEHPDRSFPLNNLASSLSTRYEQYGPNEDLVESIILQREALDLCPRGHPARSMSLNNLAIRLFSRYKRHGAMRDLEEAIALDREALDLRPRGHPDRSTSLHNLAIRLFTRYERHGAIEDLDEAIFLDRQALDIRPRGHPDRSMSLNNLARYLCTRYDRYGTTEDLEEGIVFIREALGLRPQGHPDRPMSLGNLAIYLFARYKRYGTRQDLDEAIILDREALTLSPPGHADRSITLNGLAVCLSARYDQYRAIEDLDEAISLAQESLDLRPRGHTNRSESLINLARHLSTRYDQSRAIDNIHKAIDLSREALELCPPGHHDRSMALSSLACHLFTRFVQLEQLMDIEEVFTLYGQLVDVGQIVSSIDLSAAKEWIRMAEYFKHSSLLHAYETSLRLLVQHLATLPSLPQHLPILKHLTSSLSVDAFSAFLRHHRPAKAVELLEQGRGVFWSQLLRLRSPLEDVLASGRAGKKLADEFSQLSSDIRNALNSPRGDQHERVFHLNVEMQKVVSKIRKLPGLSRFLLPSLFSDLQCAAEGGPIIIVNASEYSCDALVVLPDRDPFHIPLEITPECVQDLVTELRTLTKYTTREDTTRKLAFFLRKLWDRIVSPIVDFLQTFLPSQSRIWWCPTAEFSVLPLHASGPYRPKQRNLIDIYISSYTPTLTALIRARRRGPLHFPAKQKCFIAIGQSKPVGESELPSVGEELENVGKCVGGLATFTRIDGEESCIARVTEELPKNEWVHFSCHGLPNRTHPFQSAFALRDGRLTIQQLIGCELKNPEFVYLSACHTTVGDEKSPDEVIHLASAMQFAGFRSVIGTMWAVDDGETNKITSTFYKHMVDESGSLDHTRAAYALNKTMKTVNIPLDQRVLYIHLGA